MRKLRLGRALLIALDLGLLPGTLIAGALLKTVRRIGLHRLRFNRRALLRIGLLPIRHHYYEPLLHPGHLRRPLEEERTLPGIDWNLDGQRQLLSDLHYEHELKGVVSRRPRPGEFAFGNGSFESGDAEFLYQMIRARKPARVVEIGSGFSTLIAQKAMRRNCEELRGYHCEHVCIEPFEMPWLEATGVSVIRRKVEEVGFEVFAGLEENDILFIDSSHIIRPQGDVVTEYLELLPRLRRGVIVHVHDIFSPRDYLREWVIERAWLWNEQYLLEAFLTQNDSWKIIAALNLLHHRHFHELRRVCPFLTADREPGSFYIQRM